MESINIEEILDKHSFHFKPLKLAASRDGKGGTEYDRMKAAIKEIVEAVIDKCAEKSFNTCDDSEFYDVVKVENILKIKEIINYD